jgi:hypothetical protein
MALFGSATMSMSSLVQNAHQVCRLSDRSNLRVHALVTLIPDIVSLGGPRV